MSSGASSSTKADDSGATGTLDVTDASSTSPDDLFSEFRRLCQQLEGEPSYNAKTKIVADFIKNGSGGGRYMYCVAVPRQSSMSPVS